ncbi:hypothetical protein NFI96_023560 [Prochilodus magdalenae]|nr:hypothetical protein NFI96_023560 [Prochilodus magdalenae]
MFDEPVQIKLSGLTARQHVELQSNLKDDKGVTFKATATYQADGNGEVDLSRHPSLGGTYTGVEPMGLFWSMRPDVPHSKVVKRDASTPLNYHIVASSGGEVLAQVTNERHLAAPGVRRTPVREGRIRGTLFTPPADCRVQANLASKLVEKTEKDEAGTRQAAGTAVEAPPPALSGSSFLLLCTQGEGPFSAIIDLYTLGGILCEPRAALLASKGYLVLALALYGYQDMPRTVEKIDLEYFEEAATFVQNLPEAKKTGIGIVSISKSGEIALAMASFLPNVKATVWLNGSIANVLFPLHYKDLVIPPLAANIDRITITESGIMDIKDVLEDPMAKENHASVIPIERATCNFLFVVSEDDRNYDSVYFGEQASNILRKHGKSNYEVPVQIKLSGLTARQHVELQSNLKDDKGVTFKATATYQADGNGEVDLSRHPSLGGTYTGVEPMGLFWSMRPDVPHSKVVKRDASTPLNYHIVASSGGEVLAQVTNERHLAAPGVRRTPVREGRIRGTLFTPPGEGPFPGIIDLYTFGGSICEPRAALLASKGFVVLALAYYGYQDMPKEVKKFDLEYFEEAATFLQMLPEVQRTGIGILSLSKGGELALSMASFLPNVKATVCINSCNAVVLTPLHYKDMVVPPLTVCPTKMDLTKPGILDVRDVLDDPMAKENLATVIPIERASCNFLFVVAEDDRNWNSPYYAEQACRRLKEHGKTNYELVTYPKAGHFLEVPYMPHHPCGVHPAVGKVVAFGGVPKSHADAQVEAWRRVQEFFKTHLECCTGLLNLHFNQAREDFP